MKTNKKIRQLREQKRWSQEYMAEKIDISPSSYSKLERGETKLHLDKLNKIAQVLEVDIIELIDDNGLVCVISENSDNSVHYGGNYYHGGESLIAENQRLQLALEHQAEIISYKDELLAQKDSEIASLKSLVEAINK